MALQAKSIDNPVVYEGIKNFGDYLRSNFTAMTDNELISFEDELKCIKAYLRLEKLNFGDKLKVEYDLEINRFMLPALCVEPLVENAVRYGIGVDEHDHEGRVITLEYPDFFLVCAYVPNSQDGLRRLDYRMTWEDAMRAYLCGLPKPVILCGDLNVAHEDPASNRRNAGFTDEERAQFGNLLAAGFIDTWRFQHPDEVKYSWWSYRFNARANNAGWRIDYFVVSDALRDRILSTDIHNEIFGSDHCPVELVLR